MGGDYKKIKNSKISYIFEKKTLVAASVGMKIKKYLKEKNQLSY